MDLFFISLTPSCFLFRNPFSMISPCYFKKHSSIKLGILSMTKVTKLAS